MAHQGCTGVVGIYSLTASAEGRVEHQKLNQTAPYTVSPVRWDTYFQANRVENQKLNQTVALLSFG